MLHAPSCLLFWGVCCATRGQTDRSIEWTGEWIDGGMNECPSSSKQTGLWSQDTKIIRAGPQTTEHKQGKQIKVAGFGSLPEMIAAWDREKKGKHTRDKGDAGLLSLVGRTTKGENKEAREGIEKQDEQALSREKAGRRKDKKQGLLLGTRPSSPSSTHCPAHKLKIKIKGPGTLENCLLCCLRHGWELGRLCR